MTHAQWIKITMAVYNPLREKDEIRLLRLEPGVGAAHVKVGLFHARLGKSPTYDAVSYMWGHDGGPGKTKIVLSANGGPRAIQVQENLGNALKHLRLKDKARTLWVDAICVDQANDDERGHQIAQMGKIYSQATTVRVWLGMPDELSRNAFQFLGNSRMLRGLKSGIIEVDGWEAVASLCRRKYWERLWIVQEVVLAAQIDIHCGSEALPWERFSDAFFALEEKIQVFTNVRIPFRAGAIIASVVDSAAMKIFRQRRAHTESGPDTEPTSLLSLLWIHKNAKCMRIQDKIFGMLSFAPECCRLCVPVDYKCSAYTLCRRLLEHDIRFHCSDENPNCSRDTLVRRSLNIHVLIVEGALKQQKNSIKVGSPDLEVELQEGIPSPQPPSPITILGNELGRVAFVTAPLKSLFLGDRSLMVPRAMVKTFQDMRFGCEDSETPELTTRMTRALRQIWRSKEMDIISRPRKETALNLGMVDLLSPELQANRAIHMLQTFMKFCSEFLRTSEDVGANPQYQDCLMYLAKAGFEEGFCWKVGFAPIGTELGDSVCTFKDTNIIAIVRKIEGDHAMVGQGSTVASPKSRSAPQTGNVLSIQIDISTLQMFSRIHQPSELPDYRLAVLIAPESSRPRIPITASRTRTVSGEAQEVNSSSENPSSHRRRENHRAGTYSCLRCRATFKNSRDNLIHAALWSHQQCNRCRRWTSWQSRISTTSTTPYCMQCRVDDTGCPDDLASRLHEAARISWSNSSIDESDRDPVMTPSEDLSLSGMATPGRRWLFSDHSLAYAGIPQGLWNVCSHNRNLSCDERGYP
jgi:hypothetical protein